MPNATAVKFGHPDSLVFETASWSVQVRPQQPTLGALVVVCKEPVTAFGGVSAAGFIELARVTARVEAMLKAFTRYDRMNWLMLMMVDPDVHFHVIPRYAGEREHAGRAFPDAGWPAMPALGQAVTLDRAEQRVMAAALNALEPNG